MRRIALAVAAVVSLGLAAVPATAGASPAIPATVCQSEACTVYNNYWNQGNNHWAESTVAHNWYLSPTNITEIIGNGGGSWQEYVDENNESLCVTLDWANGGSTDKLLDETCANHPSQLWASHTFGNAQTWYLYNQYLTPSKAGCANSHQAVIDAPSPTAGLTMRCVQTNGNPLPEQLWVFEAG